MHHYWHYILLLTWFSLIFFIVIVATVSSSRGFGGSTTVIPTHFPAWVEWWFQLVTAVTRSKRCDISIFVTQTLLLTSCFPIALSSLEILNFGDAWTPTSLIFWEVFVQKLRLLPWPSVWWPGEMLGSVGHGESSWWSHFFWSSTSAY